VTGWHRFQPVKLGDDWLASAEFFRDDRPVPEDDRAGTIRKARAPTEHAAAELLERLL